MICLYAGSFSAWARGRKKLFPRERITAQIFFRLEVKSLETAKLIKQTALDDQDILVGRVHNQELLQGTLLASPDSMPGKLSVSPTGCGHRARTKMSSSDPPGARQGSNLDSGRFGRH